MTQSSGFYIKQDLIKEYGRLLKKYRALFLHAPSGFGKTLQLTQGLQDAGIPFSYVSCQDKDALTSLISCAQNLVVLDDVHLLSDPKKQQALLEVLAALPAATRLVLLSRRGLPSAMKALEVSSQLLQRGEEDLKLNPREVAALLNQMDLLYPDYLPSYLALQAEGYPLAIRICTLRLQRGLRCDQAGLQEATQEVYDWYDARLMAAFPLHIRELLMYVAPFATLPLALAVELTGNPDIKPLLDSALHLGSFLNYDPGTKEYHVHPFFQEYLLSRQKIIWSEQQRVQNDEKAGAFLEAQGDIDGALACYSRAGDKKAWPGC